MTTAASPPQADSPAPRRWRWGVAVILVLLAGIAALGWQSYMGQRAVRQLRDAGFEVESEPWLGARVWAAARTDWRLVFDSAIWKSRPSLWKLEGAEAGELRHLDAVAPALRRVNPKHIVIWKCLALQNVDGLRGLTRLQNLQLIACPALQNVDGLKGLTGLQVLGLTGCTALQNVDMLNGLTGLQDLSFNGGAALQNVDGLKGLTGLQWLDLTDCTALQNVDGLKGVTGLITLNLQGCRALQDVDGLKGLIGLQSLDLRGCTALQNIDGFRGLTSLQTLELFNCYRISAPALRELRAALPRTDIAFPDGSKLPPK